MSRMKTELKIGFIVLAGWAVVKLMKIDPAAKRIPELIDNGALVIDVRTAGEFSGGHIEGAMNIPYDRIARELPAVEADKSRPVIVYCRSGARAAAAKKSLIQAGCSSVVNAGTLRNMRRLLKP